MTPSLVVDASVAVKWFVPEPGSARAAALRQTHNLMAPDLLVTEVTNVLWKQVRRGTLAPSVARTAATQLATISLVTLEPAGRHLVAALDIALRYQRSVYDSLYLALAVAENCPLVTADQRLVNSLQGTPLASSVVALSSI